MADDFSQYINYFIWPGIIIFFAYIFREPLGNFWHWISGMIGNAKDRASDKKDEVMSKARSIDYE